MQLKLVSPVGPVRLLRRRAATAVKPAWPTGTTLPEPRPLTIGTCTAGNIDPGAVSTTVVSFSGTTLPFTSTIFTPMVTWFLPLQVGEVGSGVSWMLAGGPTVGVAVGV